MLSAAAVALSFLLAVVAVGCATGVNGHPPDARTDARPIDGPPDVADAGTAYIGPSTALTVAPSVAALYQAAVDSFNLTKASSTLPKLNNAKVVVGTLTDRQSITIPDAAANRLSGQLEGYWMEVNADQISIIGSTNLGALHGLSVLERTTIANNGNVAIETFEDWPEIKNRTLHLVQRSVTPERLKKFVNSARLHNFNSLAVMISDGINTVSMERVLNEGHWTKENYTEFVRYSEQNGLQFIPAMALLTNQNNLLKKRYPSLMYDYPTSADKQACTYDPAQESTYEVVLPMIDDVIRLTQAGRNGARPAIFLIGHDEVNGHSGVANKNCELNTKGMLPPELFLQHVIRINNHLKAQGVQALMWADMLISEEEYPSMKLPNTNGGNALHGLRYRDFNLFSKIPKDIIIGDWHYFNRTEPEYPSILALALNGYKVFGATWDNPTNTKNFANYVVNMPMNIDGMIATTWRIPSYIGYDSYMHDIISVSGDAFWRASKTTQPVIDVILSHPADNTIKQNTSAADTLTITSSNNTANKQVVLYADNLPQGIYVTFLPTACAPTPLAPCNVMFKTTVSSSVAAGNYSVNVNAVVGSNTQTTTFKLIVAPGASPGN